MESYCSIKKEVEIKLISFYILFLLMSVLVLLIMIIFCIIYRNTLPTKQPNNFLRCLDLLAIILLILSFIYIREV